MVSEGWSLYSCSLPPSTQPPVPQADCTLQDIGQRRSRRQLLSPVLGQRPESKSTSLIQPSNKHDAYAKCQK